MNLWTAGIPQGRLLDRLTRADACESLTLTMRVTAKGEYAAQAALYLARRYPDVMTIQEIAGRHHIPLKYLEQILLELKRGGILESRRGVHGGYTLARDPANISVGEVLRIVDGAFTESSCTHARERLGSECAEGENCGLRRLWQDVQDAMEKILFETSLDDLRRSSSDVVGRKQPLARIHAS